MATDVDPVDPHAGLEAWHYTARGKLYLQMYTGKHGDVQYRRIDGGRTFHLSPAERHLNSDPIRDPKKDPFKNGTCIPLRLTDETPAEDREQIESNPASLTDEQIIALFSTKKGQEDRLPEMLASIDNPTVLERIADLAVQADLPPSKTGPIKARLEEIDPGVAGERVLVPAANEIDSADIYGDTAPPASRMTQAE